MPHAPDPLALPRRTVYPYTNADGVTVRTVTRTEDATGKRFTQSGDTSAPLLYRLSEVIEGVALDKPIHVTEGEKDADTLAALGLTATTTAGGINAPWLAAHSEPLRGADVVIHADNDDAGRKGAERRAAALHGIAARVRVIHYTELPDKGDVSDYLAAGATFDALLARVDAAPTWAPPAVAPLVRTAADYASDPATMEPPRAIVGGIAFDGRFTMLAAEPKGGKSTYAAAMAAAVTRGAPLLGVPAQRGRVLWLMFEELARDAVQRFQRFGADLDAVDIMERLPDDGLAGLLPIIAAGDYALVVIDTLAALMGLVGVADFNSAAQTIVPVMQLATIAHAMRGGLVALHHAKKDGGYRDSTAIAGAVDVKVELTTPSGASASVRRFKCVGRVPVPDFDAQFDGTRYTLTGGDAATELRVLDTLRDAGEPLSKRVLRQRTRGGNAAIDAALAALLQRGLVTQDAAGAYTLMEQRALALVADADEPAWVRDRGGEA